MASPPLPPFPLFRHYHSRWSRCIRNNGSHHHDSMKISKNCQALIGHQYLWHRHRLSANNSERPMNVLELIPKSPELQIKLRQVDDLNFTYSYHWRSPHFLHFHHYPQQHYPRFQQLLSLHSRHYRRYPRYHH